MREASKTLRLRGQRFIDEYLSGSVLDIGCGPDLVVPHARPFDLADGDANQIGNYLPAKSFDCVHSSHCLEHMHSAPSAVEQWWSLVKPGGVMIITVPHEDLYEQGFWPSIFNPDHKGTFRLDKPDSWSPVSHDVRELMEQLPDAKILEVEIQDAGYDYRWKRRGIHLAGRIAYRLSRMIPGLKSKPFHPQQNVIDRVVWYLGKPVDQTQGEAVAQIQVVVRKLAPV